MPVVGVDYESNPAGFLAATRQVMDSSAEAVKGFDLTNASLKRLAVQYLNTGDAAKQGSYITRMAAIQTADDVAASQAKIAAAEKVSQDAALKTAEVQSAAAEKVKGAGVTMAGALFGVAAAGEVVRKGFELIQTVSAANAQTTSTLQATGAAARITAGTLEDVSTSWEKVGQFSKEAAAQGLATLSQFTAVTRTKEMFDETATAAGNLARQTGKDLPDAAQALGRALQSPLNAGRNLRTLNILLNADQLASIKNYMKLGETAQAQAVILDAANAKSAGSMKAFSDSTAGGIAKAKNAADELAIQFTNTLAPAIRFVGDHAKAFTDIAVAVGSVWIAAKGYTILQTIAKAFTATAATSVAAEASVATAATAAASTTADAWAASMAAAGTDVGAFVTAADGMFASVAAAAATEGAAAGAGFASSFMAALGPIGILFAGMHAAGVKSTSQLEGDPTLQMLLHMTPAQREAYKASQGGGGAPSVSGTISADTLSSISTPYTPLGLSTHRTDIQDLSAAYGGARSAADKQLIAQGFGYHGPGPKGAGGGGGGGGGALTSAQAAALTFGDRMSQLKKNIAEEGQIHPTSMAYAKQLMTAEQDTLATARQQEKHAKALYDEANGAKAKHAALQVLQKAQADVNAATKNVNSLKAQEKDLQLAAAKAALALKDARLEAMSNMADQATADAIAVKEAKEQLDTDKAGTLAYYQDLKAYNQAVATAAQDATSAAQQAKQDAIALANAQVEAGIDYSNPTSALQAAVTEARNNLAGDTAGTTQFYQDTAALNQALYNLSQATASNTSATTTNTQAMTGVLAGGQVPGYIALRGANQGAFLNPHSGPNGGTRTPIVVNVQVDGKTLATATVGPLMQEMNGVLTFNPRALVTPTG